MLALIVLLAFAPPESAPPESTPPPSATAESNAVEATPAATTAEASPTPHPPSEEAPATTTADPTPVVTTTEPAPAEPALPPDQPPPASENDRMPAPTLEELDKRRFELHVMPRVALRLIDTVDSGGSIQVGLGIRLVRGLFLDAEFGEGLYGPPLQLAGSIAFAMRWEIRKSAGPDPRRFDRVRPNLWLGFTHAHQSHGHDFADQPGASLLGTAKTINHRTGLMAGVGLRFPFPARWGRHAPRFAGVVRSDVAYYVDLFPARLQIGLAAGFSVVF